MNSSLKQAATLTWSQVRRVSTTAPCLGKRNFRKFPVHNIRGTFHDRRRKDRVIETYGLREPSVSHRGPPIPEMVPELIVPDLTDCKLQPYVSYRAPEVCQGPFTARDLFDAVYSEAVAKDFQEGQADKSIRHLEAQPSPDEARLRARQTGSDIFPPLWRARNMEDQ
ncbi:39S ribosomal protein L41, mitochondrial [Rhipicephalus sanguineus]|uniref:39S ribosomal protein L41, mitochondrial n=1 Tax=Rhipicephalus sanguineus TaxID=34632 RepID=UPI00189492FE|nr:39S ribosomal protein L41, mitochondrial [Rhipicephalus sanguineus]